MQSIPHNFKESKMSGEKDAQMIECSCGRMQESTGRICGFNPVSGRDCLYVWAEEGGMTRIIELAGVRFCPYCGDELKECKRVEGEALPSFVLGHIFQRPMSYVQPKDSPSYEFMGKPKSEINEV